MYMVEKRGYIFTYPLLYYQLEKSVRITHESKLWVIWRTMISPGTCYFCASMDGRILSVDDPITDQIPKHPNCGCHIEALSAIVAGTGTNAGANGVDLYMAQHGILPDYYISKDDAEALGWRSYQGNLAEVLPGRMIGGGRFKNKKKQLPDAPRRVWYEADFDYVRGFRNDCRLLYSNDGLIFITYDHYLTFYEIVLEEIKWIQ